ncbi:hypothetical protein LAZ67_11001043 [Cordylochernes scorpioides]|uniref:DDE-1 domain-containing protein n=1 Tax=Cordylochernes scorpioides TaxID=51811 RepID=A0ABY6L1K6_9ARAC|nr:hypothetical protein LAZ67_11001043 [Cordylochernes scorpioides]
MPPSIKKCDVISYIQKLKEGRKRKEKGVATETHELIKEAFGDAALSRSRTFEGFSRFLKGRERVNHDQHTGRPRSLRCDENKLKIKELIKSNRRISIKDLSSETGLSVGLCHQIVTKDLDMIRTSSKFVPRILTEEQKEFLAKNSTIHIPHPPYSPDLAPYDFFLYPKLKIKIKGRKFDNVDMIQAESKATLRNLSKNEEAARKYPEKLAKIIKDGGYCAHQIFNADETGLFWKKMPTRTYIAKSEKNASGFEAAKDRVTLLLCSNASGDRMLNPLLVNRSLKPCALKGKDLNTLPVHWMANKKAWVTTAIFTEWFNKCFVPEVENYMKEMGLEFKILLILDNAPGHPNLEHPNIKVVFFPPNTTSLIQPLDQGIISTFKKYYVKFTFQFIFDKLESDTITVTEVWKQFNILNCVDHVALAIAEIKSQTLNACWKAAWPECVSKRNESNRTTIVTSDIISIAIGGEGFDDFGEHDIEELLVDEALNDDDILENSELEDVTPLDVKLLREGLQLSGKLENFFIQNDNDVECALKFQRDMKFCMSGYRELYKELVKPSQRLITDYLVKEKKITEVPKEALPCRFDDVILSSSDESDLAPIHKRVRTLSDSE